MRRAAEWARGAWRHCRAAPGAPGSKGKARSSPVVRIVRYNGVGGFASQLLKRGGEGFMHENIYTHSPWPQTGEEKRGRGEGEERAGVRSGGCRALGSGTVGRELKTSEATRMHR